MLYGSLETVCRWAKDPSNRKDEVIRITYLGTVGTSEEYDHWGFWWHSPEELAEETTGAICPRCGKSAERMGPRLVINGIRVCEKCYTHYITKWQDEVKLTQARKYGFKQPCGNMNCLQKFCVTSKECPLKEEFYNNCTGRIIFEITLPWHHPEKFKAR